MYDLDISADLLGSDPSRQYRILTDKSHYEAEEKAAIRHAQLVKHRISNQETTKDVFKQYAQQQSPGSTKWCVWISETLTVDLNLSLPIRSGVVQVFFIGIDCPAVILTLYDKNSSKEDVEEYAYRTGVTLKWAILGFCHLDFLLLTCMQVEDFSLDSLTKSIHDELQKKGRYFGGRKRLDEAMFNTLLKSTIALAGCTSVPLCILESAAAENGDDITLYLMERAWRDKLSKYIEDLDKTGCLQLGSDADEKNMWAAMEAVKRVSTRDCWNEMEEDDNEGAKRPITIETDSRKVHDYFEKLNRDISKENRMKLVICTNQFTKGTHITTYETSSCPVLRRPVLQKKETEAFLKQLHDFPNTFQLLYDLPHDKKKRLLSGLRWAISVGYRSERTASLEEARARNMAAFLLHCLGRPEEALQELNTVLKLEGQSNNLVTLANKAVILCEQHKLSQALQQLQTFKAIQDDPDSDFEYLIVRAKAELAFTYSRLGPDFHCRGLELFREVMPQAREPEIWLWKFGHVLTWQRILRADPESSLPKPSADITQEQSDLLTELLEIAHACTCTNTKAKAFTELAFVLNMVWKVYGTRREFMKRTGLNREECCEQAIHLDRQDHSVLVKCGRIFRYTRRTDESRELLEKAVSMRPSSTGYHHLGLTYKALATRAIHKHENKVSGYYRYMEEWHSPRGARNPQYMEASHSSRGARNPQYMEASHSPRGARNPQYMEEWHSPRGAKNPRDGSDYKDTVRQFGRMSLDDDRSTGAGTAGYSGHTPRGRGFHSGNRPASDYRGGRNLRPDRFEIPDPRALGIDPDVMPSLSLSDIRKMQRIIRSPAIQGVTTFSRDNEFIMEAMQCFEIAFDVSKGENTRAAYDLALLYRCLGEYEQAKIYLLKMLSHEHNFYPTDEIMVYEQLGLVMKELSEMEKDEQTKQQLMNDSKQWLLIALKAASEFYAKSLQKQIGEIWRSFSSLMDEMKTYNDGVIRNLTNEHVEKAQLFRLIRGHEDSLAVLKDFERLSPKDKDDPEILAEYIKNFAEMKEYHQVLTYLNLLKGTVQRERVTELLGEDFSERQINMMAGKQALLSAPADDSPFAAVNAFKKSFDDVYKVESMPSTTSSEGGEAAVNSNNSGTSEGNGVNPEPAASTSRNIRPVRRQWDVAILHEEESIEKADSLVRVLRDLCKLRVTARHSEIKPGMLELEFSRVMERSKVVLVLVETDDHKDEVLTLLTNMSAFYPFTVVLFTEGAEDKIPDVLKSHRKFLCHERLLDNSLNPREAFTEDVADMVCQLMDFLTDTKNLK